MTDLPLLTLDNILSAAPLALVITVIACMNWRWWRLPKEERKRRDAEMKENDDGWGV